MIKVADETMTSILGCYSPKEEKKSFQVYEGHYMCQDQQKAY